MVIVLKQFSPKEKIDALIKEIEDMGVKVQVTVGTETSILGLVGDTTTINRYHIAANEIVEKVLSVQEPYKKANRMFKPENSVIDVEGRKIGGTNIATIAGPCSVESEEQIVSVAKEIKAAGATFLRGGAYKPRTSPYSFQGLGLEGLELLKTAKIETGLPIV